ncbi:hypothetical protein ACQPYA_04260 [Micromonospora sp. CA-263727]|uniref:hypothetical protein n=1 Tax=Micromonospora sp. CA-263727 TaxID=3239967 RepID=UPI003D90A44A
MTDRVQSGSALVTVTGVPVLRWEPAPVICQVDCGPDGLGHERLLGVVVEEMQARGAMPLRDRDLVPDAVGDLPPLSGWYAQIHGTAVTVWMPPSWRAPVVPSAGPRRVLATFDGLPASWLAAVAEQGRLVLETSSAPIRCQKGLSMSSLPQHAGGMVAAGSADDQDRDLTLDRLRRRSAPARPAAPLIEVADLWATASVQARRLAAAHNALVPRSQAADPDLIALVIVGLIRQDGEAELAAVAQRLADPQVDLVPWLELMIAPTTLADRLADVGAAIRRDARDPGTLAYPFLGWVTAATRARAAVDRQRLIDAGGLRLGDQVRCLPERGAGGEVVPGEVVSGEVRALATMTWPPATFPRAWPQTWFEVATGAGNDSALIEHSLLLADDDDPRAVAQAAYAAAADLYLYAWVSAKGPVERHDPLRRAALRQRYTLHTIAPVRQILHEVHDASDADLDHVVATAIVRLSGLAPRYSVPGGILPST